MMIQDAGTAQARELLRAMHQQVAVISHRIEKAEQRECTGSIRGAAHARRTRSALRRELHEAHRLIDGLRGRFPEARCDAIERLPG